MLNNTDRKIINMVRQHPLISRVEIVEKLKISKPIVSISVKKLMEKGLLKEEDSHKTPSKGFGRKRIGLSFVPDCINIIGIDIGGTKLEGIVGDLDGNIIHTVTYSTKNIKTKERLFNLIYRAIDELLHASKKDVLGIGIGVPGTVNTKNLTVEYMPAFELKNIDLKTPVEEKYGLPTFIENDVTLDVYAEHRIGAGRGKKNLFLVSIGTGVGGGIIINGDMYTGANGKAGELGEMITDWRKDKNTRTKTSFGALELWISGNSLEKKLSSMGIKSVKEGFELLEKNKDVEKVIKEGIEHLGVAISNIIFLFGLEVIIIKGGIGYNQFEKIMEYMLPVIEDVVPSEILCDVDFKKGVFGRFGVAIGGLFYVEKEVLKI